MLDLRKYSSLGAALRDAIERWPNEICLIEADRERENCRLTYRQFRDAALPLARSLQDLGFKHGARASIIMTNQSKWLISAYAIFYCGGVLVPLDYKLTPEEQLRLLEHSQAEVLVAEYHLWRAIAQSREFDRLRAKVVLAVEVPPGAELFGARRWEECRGEGEPVFAMRQRKDPASIVYSSGTGGRAKGCVLTHENYLELCMTLTAVYPFGPGDRYLSILPTNHVIDFMGGFFAPFSCGGAVVHLRTLRPGHVREAFPRYKITYTTLVPLILKTLQKAFQARFDALPPAKRRIFNAVVAINTALTTRRPHLWLSRLLLKEIHQAFGGELRTIIVGGAFSDPQTLQFFYDLGILVANGYGSTEGGAAITLNDFKPFRADTVGKPLPGVEVKIVNPDAEGIGEVAVRSKTVMSHYLDDPELTAETIVDGWLMMGDLGRLDATGHLQLFGRKKNMIVTEEGKNVYPEDIEKVFDGLAVKDFCVFAANYLWPQRSMTGEQLVLVVHLEDGRALDDALRSDIAARNRRLLNYKRVSGIVPWQRDFPRTTAMKIKRDVLAEEIRRALERRSVISL